MVREHEIDKFVSVQLYSQGNVYQATHANAFKELSGDDRFQFIPLQFEAFIEKGNAIWGNDEQKRKWLQYLEERYIVK